MPNPQHTRLDSWKEIADYLGRDVTTVIRWEKEKGLPVHRLPRRDGFGQRLTLHLPGHHPQGAVSLGPSPSTTTPGLYTFAIGLDQ